MTDTLCCAPSAPTLEFIGWSLYLMFVALLVLPPLLLSSKAAVDVEDF